MKPLIGLQLATYVDRGFIALDEPIGNFLPDFDTPADRNLTFRPDMFTPPAFTFPGTRLPAAVLFSHLA